VRGSGPPLVLLHGFTQTGRLWGPFGDRLALDNTLIGIDLPGHGGSDDVRADLPATAHLVHETVEITLADRDESPGPGWAVLGYSLGARVALHVLTETTAPVDRCVLIGVTGGMEDEAERARRRTADEHAADALERSGDVRAFLDGWLAGPMFSRLAGAARQLDERARNTAQGLASSLRLSGTGTQAPLWDRLPSIDRPVLALAGTDDTRFAAHALRVGRSLPDAVATLVPGGGHAAHLAQPAQTWRIVRHWLDG
jgi:2-succinyl-6-hydroxy-2,4-cyclohexadiene-1-carboxylate synthase